MLGYLAAASLALASLAAADDWPQWRGPGRDGVWKEQGIVAKFDGPQVPIRWRVPVANGYSGPTVADGRVYLTDRVTDPKQQERIRCFDWKTGKELWSRVYDAAYGGTIGYDNGPRAAVTVDEGRAYALGAVGHLHCLDAASGKVLWSKDLLKQYDVQLPTWGIAAAPLIEGGLVILHVGGKNACLIAFDKKTGEERWKALPDRASYSAPVVIDLAGKRVLLCWTGDRVVALDPQSGKLNWEYPFPAKMIVDMIATPVVNKDWLFLTSVYEGSLMLRLKPDGSGVDKVWERQNQNPQVTDGLHSLISTPIVMDDHVYGINFFGELRCLGAKTGLAVWEDKTVVPRATWATAHLIRNADHVWIFNERGQLIIARISPKGYEEISRSQLIKPTLGQLNQRGGVAWAHPAFAYKHVFARNDEELVCASLEAK